MRPRLRFSTKIFLVLAGLVCLTLALAVGVFEQLTSRRFEESVSERFARAQTAFRELQSLRESFVSDEVASLARGNPQFRTVLSTASLAVDMGFDLGLGDRHTEHVLRDAHLRLRSLVPSLVLAERSDALVVLAADGRLLFSLADPQRFGADLSHLAVFRRTVSEGRASDVWLAQDARPEGPRLLPEQPAPAVYRVVGQPVVFEDAIHGVVLAASRIEEADLRTLLAISGLELVLAADGVLVATTLGPVAREALELMRPGLAPGAVAPTSLELAGHRYLVRQAAVAPEAGAAEASFVLLAPLDAELRFLRRLRTSLLATGGAILLAALATALLLARGITRPVELLAGTARRIGAGDLDVRVELDRSDELGELGRAFDDMTAGLRERDRIRRTFERYVSKAVAEEVLQHPELAPVSGARRELTVCFVDVAGFTALAESAAPERVVELLNAYLEEVCQAILAFDGTVNEFLGDGVVAFWGAPIPQPDHATRACLAALRARERLAELAARWRERGLAEPRFRIGLHTGELVVGEIGARERRAYRAVGDAMNLAARIEGANKRYGTAALASEATVARTGGMVLARELDLVRVVGRAQPIRLYELVAETALASEAQRALVARYDEALARYRARGFEAAAAAFEACLAIAKDDGPASLGLARARALAAEPPPPDWDGIHDLESK